MTCFREQQKEAGSQGRISLGFCLLGLVPLFFTCTVQDKLHSPARTAANYALIHMASSTCMCIGLPAATTPRFQVTLARRVAKGRHSARLISEDNLGTRQKNLITLVQLCGIIMAKTGGLGRLTLEENRFRAYTIRPTVLWMRFSLQVDTCDSRWPWEEKCGL